MTTLQRPTSEDGPDEMARQLDVLRDRSRHVAVELHRIRAELVELIRGIDSHLGVEPPKPSAPAPRQG
jgi:hypothetical protein